MENRRILVDTSIIIEFLRKTNKEKSALWKLKEAASCTLSAVSQFELLAGATDARKREDIATLVRWIPVAPFDAETAEIAGEIYRELRERNELIEFRDIFIAATAKQHTLELATFNVKHFERVDGLPLTEL